jgi:hypothetical protein
VVWKKIEPVVAGARKQIRPTWLWNLERMAKRHQAWRERTFAIAERLIKAESRLKTKKPRSK